ncbi:predicted protein [Postia placenta Mad-698-R]|uniref:Uncharacterized protein n=1 Tax=Postia placenta MAD-698-R-SB12 TaxID=670580 RepID=A0A1X6NG14_9APHY|nr:hypothetical protein POSPLADRAFT_1128262 [Postia placenta MAD-698-R-SB12]EED83933.1 predicted protein [Postia placenta Mad-698-R]OSX67564.1 hypothetical protein POSPLADRAFT_1128262 [Postia placenta MAD-698-R-SB12]
MASAPLSDLLSVPFGPFRDEDVLTDACKSVPSNVLGLHDFMLEFRGKPIGLTQSEAYQPEYRKESAERVRFRGVLEIKSPSWLTLVARKSIEEEIHRRDRVLAERGGRRVPSKSPDLEWIYRQRGYNANVIKVLIQGMKYLPAVFLMSKEVPNGLRIHSKHNQLIPLFQYLSRYRTLRLLSDLIKVHAQTLSSTGDRTAPREDRTAAWFADLYEEHMSRSYFARTRRLIYDSGDSDIEPRSGGKLKPGHEHILRHIPRAEVLSLLAANAKWVLEEQSARQGNTRFLDIEVWNTWVQESRAARRDAARQGAKWGRDLVETSSDDSSEDERPPRMMRNKPKSKASTGSKAVARRSPSISERMVVDNVDLSVLRSYDPDFSPPSTPDASDSESEHSLPSRPSTPPNPSIYALIHPAFFNPPRLPTDDFTWVCPVDDCHYRIAMLNLTEGNCAKLDPDDAQRLKAGNWRFREIWVQGCFRWMVSCHFEDHLDKEGIVVGEDGRPEWKNPRHHESTPWPPSRIVQQRARANPVKEESD